MNPIRPLSQVAKTYRREGWRRAVYEAELILSSNCLSISDRKLEAKFGMETRREVALSELLIGSPNRAHGFMYVGTPVTTFDAIMQHLSGAREEQTFIDYGSGKGRTLIMAAEHGFRHVIGIEFSPELHAIAEHNVQRYRQQSARAAAIELVHGDAAEYDLPPSDSVLYFNNPFNEHVMAAVLSNIEATHARSNRRVTLVYHQMREDLETDPTHNLAMLRRHPRLSERPFAIRSRYQRWLTRLFSIGIFDLNTRPSLR